MRCRADCSVRLSDSIHVDRSASRAISSCRPVLHANTALETISLILSVGLLGCLAAFLPWAVKNAASSRFIGQHLPRAENLGSSLPNSTNSHTFSHQTLEAPFLLLDPHMHQTTRESHLTCQSCLTVASFLLLNWPARSHHSVEQPFSCYLILDKPIFFFGTSR